MSETRPIGSILAATDLSPESRHAVDRAAALAGMLGAHLAVVHALPSDPLDEVRGWLGMAQLAETMRVEAARELQAQVEAVRGRHPLAIEHELRVGRVLDEILACADARGADLVVVGARGASRLRRLALGTTAERLLRRSRRPVLVVRRLAHGPYRRLLLPVDFSPWSDAAVRLARAIAPDAHLCLLHAWQVPFEGKLRLAGLDDATIDQHRRDAEYGARRLLDALAAAHGLGDGRWTPVLVHGEPWSAIAEAEQAQDIDLVVIGKHGRNVAEELLLGSVTKGVVTDATADVLVATVA